MAPVVSLHGLAKHWFRDPWMLDRVKSYGLSGMMVTYYKDQKMAKKDEWHALHNGHLVVPVMHMMRDGHLLRTPYVDQITHQVAVFAVLFDDKPFSDEAVAEAKLALEVDIHCITSSIKKIISFTRRKFLLPHTPRDRFHTYACSHV